MFQVVLSGRSPSYANGHLPFDNGHKPLFCEGHRLTIEAAAAETAVAVFCQLLLFSRGRPLISLHMLILYQMLIFCQMLIHYRM